MRRRDLGLVLWACILAASGSALFSWKSTLYPPAVADSKTDTFLRLFGEVRTAIAKTMWIQVDVYHHQMERQGISWKKERDILPILRAVTTLDPSFEEAYDIGAYDLVMNLDQVDAGFAYLEEGLKANPRSRLLQFEAAFLLYMQKRYREAIPHAKEAIDLSKSEIDAMNAARILAYCAEQMKEAALEKAALDLCHRLMPHDPHTNTRLRALEQASP